MARRVWGPATLQLVQAVEAVATAPLLVACSGGPDSLALAAAAAIVAGRRELPVRAAVVDHGLQSGSAALAASVVGTLNALGLDATVLPVVVDPAGQGIEAAARKARYAALSAAARPGELVLLGHNLDDQAETVLLGLVRGSGTRSLAGMPGRRDPFVRPLLGVRAAITRAACAELGLTAWIDPHNAEPRFTRTRVRERVLPMLEAELGPGVARALARSAELARADADLLDELAAAEAAAHPEPDPDCGWLSGLPPALLNRVLRDWLRANGASDLSAAGITAVAGLVTAWHGQRWTEVPGVRVIREGDRLRVRQQ